MALLRELGHEYPCSTEGYPIDVEDETAVLQPGEILEVWLTTGEDIKYYQVAGAVEEILKTKEEYPEFVLHYVRFETRKVVMQFSGSPPASVVVGIAIILGIIAAAIVAILLIPVAIERGYLFPVKPPVGDAVVDARDARDDFLLPNVKITVNGMEGTTGPNGEGILFEDLIEGEHVFYGEPVEDYDSPDPVSASVIKNDQIAVTVWYNPVGYIPPTTGWLIIDTDPVKGKIWVDGTEYGLAPQTVEVSAKDKHTISFGDIEGWLTPEQQVWTVQGAKVQGVIGKYERPPSRWWEKYITYALIGGGIIIGAALIIPEAIRALMRRKETK